MKNKNIEAENARLREKLSKAKKNEESLTRKLDTARRKNAQLQQDAKKKTFSK